MRHSKLLRPRELPSMSLMGKKRLEKLSKRPWSRDGTLGLVKIRLHFKKDS
jgi:hypothetical protein